MVIVRANAADILSGYVGTGGGISPARKINSVAEAAGLASTIGSMELGGHRQHGYDPLGLVDTCH